MQASLISTNATSTVNSRDVGGIRLFESSSVLQNNVAGEESQALSQEQMDAAADAQADAEERRFEAEMRAIEDLMVWETKITNIPEELQQPFLKVMLAYSTMQKIAIYKLLGLMDWGKKVCADMYSFLTLVPLEKLDWLTATLNRFHAEGKLAFTFTFFSLMETPVLREVFYELPDVLLERAINLGRFLSSSDLDLFLEFVNGLGVRMVLQTIDECDEPMIKHCRLCRTRRIFNLENRLQHNLVPKNMPRVTGAIAIYEKNETWTHATENSFTFDHGRGLIFWNKVLVDMMRICDKCLNDALRAATTDCTDVSIYHVLADERKPILAELRAREQQLGVLIGKIASERVRRRTKEFAIKSLETQATGERLEREAAEKVAFEAVRKAKKEAVDAEYRRTIKAAMVVDDRWVAEKLRSEEKVLSKKVHLAAMNYHMGFSQAAPAPKTLEHPHSWRHAHYLADGTPVSPEGAKQRFGILDIPPNAQFDQLHEWKETALLNHAAHERRKAELAARQREAALKEMADHKEYVDKRIKRLQRKDENTARILELEEQARQDKRKADKNARFLLRCAKMEANERFLMEVDDDHSLRRRYYEWEQWREDAEREAMWFEEMEQCGVDRFWGLDLEALNKQRERDKWIAWYDGRTQKLREQLILTKQLRPFKIEAKMRLYKDPRTGEVLK